MPKKHNNAYLARQKAQMDARIHYHRRFTMQWCADAAILAAHEVFQRKGEKLSEFGRAFFKWAQMIAELTINDAKDDRTIDYTKGKVDGMLKDLLGDDFIPWEERYDV